MHHIITVTTNVTDRRWTGA